VFTKRQRERAIQIGIRWSGVAGVAGRARPVWPVASSAITSVGVGGFIVTVTRSRPHLAPGSPVRSSCRVAQERDRAPQPELGRRRVLFDRRRSASLVLVPSRSTEQGWTSNPTISHRFSIPAAVAFARCACGGSGAILPRSATVGRFAGARMLDVQPFLSRTLRPFNRRQATRSRGCFLCAPLLSGFIFLATQYLQFVPSLLAVPCQMVRTPAFLPVRRL